MRGWRARAVAAAVVVAAAWLAGTWLATPAHAADTTPPQVVEIRIDPATVSMSGSVATKVVVSVHLTDDTGVCSDCYVDGDDMAGFVGYPLPLVRIDPGPQAPPGMFYETQFSAMKLTSGTPQDGWWSMTRIVTGLLNGHRAVIRAAASDTAGNTVDIDPSKNPDLARDLVVTATDVPHISYGVKPTITAYGVDTFTVKGRAYLDRSGTPLGNRVLLLCEDTGCGIEGSFGGTAVRTNAQGYYSVTTHRQALGLMLFRALDQQGSTASPSTFYSNPLYAARTITAPRSAHYLTLSVSGTTLRGATDAPYDASTPPAWRSVSVQRLVRGTWTNGTIVTDQTALVEPTTVRQGIHTYTLTARPPKGTWAYRVYRTSTPGFAPTARYFTLAGH